MQHLTSQHDLDAALQGPECVLLKHGAHCPISAAARREMDGFTDRNPGVALYALEVTEHRDLSDALAERLAIPHQSPQLILLRDGRAEWHATHFAITARALEDRLAG